MNKNQENRFTMHQAVKQYCDDNIAIIGTNPDALMGISLLADQITLVNALLQVQNRDIGGIAAAKNAARDIIENRALSISGRIAAWAYLNKKYELNAEMTFTKSGKVSKGLDRYADTEIGPICRKIHQTAQDNMASIPAITAPELTFFTDHITAYEELLSAPTLAIGARAVATARMEPTLDKTDELLRQGLDPLMLAYLDTNRPLLAGYKQARKILDAGLRHREQPAPPPAP